MNEFVGKVFGRWTTLSESPKRYTHKMMLCQCICGNQKIVKLESLKRGLSQSCGCLRIELAKQRYTVHGMKDTKEFMSWCSAKRRCFNAKDKKYPNYGGRGITMCDEWRDSFLNFFRSMGECPEGMTLERKDVNGNYCPSNCIWATLQRQANNKQNTLWVEHESTKVSLADYSRIHNVKYHRLWELVREHGMEPKDAVAHMLSIK